MRHLDYQRTIIAYHGCDEALANRVLQTGETLKVSENDYDWLGSGIYFWEFGPDRAMAWAEELHRRFPKRVTKPAVLGAVIQLGSCFDLLDTQHTSMLKRAHENYLQAALRPLPVNKGLMHRLDCAVINYSLPWIEQLWNFQFQTVRGVFQEGQPVFAGSDIREKSHIQIAVRDPSCILGYFKPRQPT
jgi:hypothetical protein